MDISTDITSVLTMGKVAREQNWKNFEVNWDIDREIGRGFAGEFVMASIRNIDTSEKLNLAIKKALTTKIQRERKPTREYYLNEIHFYSNVVETLKNFIIENCQQGMLDMIGKYYFSIKEECSETIVMENLKEQGYAILRMGAFLDDQHMKLIFKTYGKFHAVSFVFKDQSPEEYAELLEGINGEIEKKSDFFLNIREDISIECFKLLDESLKNRCKHIFENIREIYKEAMCYEGKHSCILHGDSWLNNLMFKHNNNVLEGIKLIDFQLVKVGTPVYDLSNIFYSGGSKELYKNLDKYLHIYYDSFVETAALLGSDANQLMTLENLKEDWQKYSKLGFIISMGLIKINLINLEDIKQIADEESKIIRLNDIIKVDNNILKEKVQDLVDYVCENKFI